MGLWDELKRRNVVKVGVAYLALAWFVIQLTDTVVPTLNLPESLNAIILYISLVGFPFAIFFAWAFELTPEGLKRSEDVSPEEYIANARSSKIERVIIGFLAAAVLILIWDNYLGDSDEPQVADQVQGEIIQKAEPEAGREAPGSSDNEASIAVLPFVDMSAEQDQEYFSDGISEEILNVLAKNPNLKVTSRSSSFALKGERLDLREVAARLGVNHILEGSVRKSNNQVRITAQLIEAESDSHLWSETYDRELENIFQLQDELSAAIGSVLELKLLGESTIVAASAVASSSISPGISEEVDPDAYLLYLQAAHLRENSNRIEDTIELRDILLQVVEIDPDFANGHARLALATSSVSQYGIIPFAEGSELMMASIDRALELDPKNEIAHRALAIHRGSFEMDFLGAIIDFEKVLEINPNSDIAHAQLARSLSYLGEYDKALEHFERAREIDPLNPSILRDEADTEAIVHNYARSEQKYREFLTFRPDNVSLRVGLSIVLILQDRSDEVFQFFQDTEEDFFIDQVFSMANFDSGNLGAADLILDQLIREEADTGAFQIAEIYCHRGEYETCVDWLEHALETRDPGLSFVVASQFLEPVLEQPRYLALIEQMGLTEPLSKHQALLERFSSTTSIQ
ncbi:MAG: tetratricopeptide repeat protein [Gammaproteobacteria bacterium]|nr:tetratricopeptide repeat protein [Gammaproteobacteria bacterium]MBT3860812.1 tetratricopeptide repeat protein [Gammaproteobacteria bacterium]MBT3986933.1 tetratricopeptide repeat protein [Gammaproteobacteria bacterium]MBT4582086.1 tetratricopeptide repeat protein [Gammaproteobacteria bacterium]MBT4658737.1 tetratricopeptide repeat protein [Gammaproteobacteria bacterium]